MIKSQCSRASLGLLISAAICDAIHPPAPCFTNGEVELASLDLERRIPSRDRFAPDSPLEEGVSSEPVSEARNSRRAPPVAA